MSIFDPKNWWGSIPKVAPYTPTEFGAEQLKAIMANIAAFPQISELGRLFQEYTTSAYEKAIPGFSEILAGGGRLTQEMIDQAAPLLRGEVPKDVAAAVQRSSAFQSLKGGFAGSAMAGANAARNLGLTSLDLISKGASLAGEAGNAAQRWMGLASNLVMSPSGMLVTPQQQAALTMQNNLYKQATQQRQFNMDAMPDPVSRGIHDTVINLIGAYLGHGMGGSTAPAQTNYASAMGVGQESYGTTAGGTEVFGPSSFQEVPVGSGWDSSTFQTGGATQGFGGAGAGGSFNVPVTDFNAPATNYNTPVSYNAPVVNTGNINPFNQSTSGYTTGYRNPFGY